MLNVSLHVFRNILSAQCRIRFEDDSENTDNLNINLSSTCLNISLIQNGAPRNSFDFFAPEGFFIPTSVSGVSSGTSFIGPETSDAHFLNSIPTELKNGKRVFESSFRFQLTNTEVLQLTESKINGKTGEIHILNNIFINNLNELSEKQISKLDAKEIMKLRIKPKTQYQIHCTSCDVPLGEVIFDDIKEHVCESFSEGWFCHHSDSLQINDKLSSDCMYLDETSFLLPNFNLMQNWCSCGASLCVEESQPNDFVRVYFDKIFFRNPELPLDDRDFQKWVSVWTLWSLIEKSRTSSLFTKLLLQSKPSNNEEETCLLLMIPKEMVSCFQFQSPISQAPITSNLWTESAYHVQYQVGTHASEDVKFWRYAFDVDFYRVSDTMMDVVTELLRDSSNKEEASKPGFSYGYLPGNVK